MCAKMISYGSKCGYFIVGNASGTDIPREVTQSLSDAIIGRREKDMTTPAVPPSAVGHLVYRVVGTKWVEATPEKQPTEAPAEQAIAV